MTDIQTWLDQGRTLADQAADHVGRLSSGEDRWTMTIPPKDTDSDMALLSLLDGSLPAAFDALQAVLYLHRQNVYGSCTSCVQNRYPCPTVRAIQDAIGDSQ